MNQKRTTSSGDQDIRERIERDPEFAEAYLEELANKPLSLQIALMRRLYGLTQVQRAVRLGKNVAKSRSAVAVRPKSRDRSDETMVQQARVLAKWRVSRVMGTMALEQQRPDNKTYQRLLKNEEEKLLRNPAEIWKYFQKP